MTCLLLLAAIFSAPNVEVPYSAQDQQYSFDVSLTPQGAEPITSFNAEVYLNSFSWSNLKFIGPNTQYSGGFAVMNGPYATSDIMTVTYDVPANTSGLFPVIWARFWPYDYSQAYADGPSNIIITTCVNGSILIQSPEAHWSGAVDNSWDTVTRVLDATNWTYNGADTHIPPTALTDVYFDKSANVLMNSTEQMKGLFVSQNTTLSGGLLIGGDGLNISNGAVLTLGASGVGTTAYSAAEPPTVVLIGIGVLTCLAMKLWRSKRRMDLRKLRTN